MTSESQNQEPAGSSTLALLRPIVLASLWRFRGLLALGVVVGVAGGVFAGLVTPNQFKSMGKLFVRPGVRESMAVDTMLSGGVLTSRSGGSREAVQNVLQALSDPDYYKAVVAKIGVDTVLAPYDPAKDGGDSSWHKSLFHLFQSWWFAGSSSVKTVPAAVSYDGIAALALQRIMLMVPEAGASVVSFHYVSHSPELAKAVVDGALDVAIKWHQQTFEKLSSQQKLEAELLNAEGEFASAEAALRKFRREKGVDEYASEHARLVAYIADLAKAIDKLDIEAQTCGAKLASQKTRLDALPKRHATAGSQQWVDNPEHVALAASRNKLRDDLLAVDRGEGGAEEKRVRRLKFEDQIKDLESRLGQVPAKIQTPPIEEPNPAYDDAEKAFAELFVELSGKTTERAETAAKRAASRTQLDDLEAIAPKLRELEEAQRQKRALVDGLASTVGNLRAVQRLEQLNVSSVGVLHQGTLDGIKIAPRRGLLVAVGAALGLAAALALVVALALFDRRVRHREDLLRLGLVDEGVLVSGGGGSGMPWMLPSSLAEIRDDIARFWSALPYERRQTLGLRIGFVPCGEGASAGRAAAALALGLAAHAGEKVCYVSALEGPTWLGQRLGLDHQCGWSEVMRGEFQLADAVVATLVSGLHYLPAGKIGPVVPHPMAGPAFAALLDRLVQMYRFVIVELPDVGLRPEGRSVLGVIDGAQLVVCRMLGSKASVREAIAAVQNSGARLLGGVLQPPAITVAPLRDGE